MIFNSVAFLVFALIFFALWPWIKARDFRRWTFVTAASLVFYGWWDWRYVFLLLGTVLWDYTAALAMVRFPRWRRLFLGLSLVGNLGALGLFKYSRFLAGLLEAGLAAAGWKVELASHLPAFVTVLPIGISFYTFQSMSYTIDVYRGHLAPTRNLPHFLAAVSLFPHLVAGPIIRAADMLPQLAGAPPVTEQDRWEGLRLVVLGFFKKCVLADNFAPVVTAAFGAKVALSTAEWWVVMLMFSFQILCDFSGYSDIARGLARWMGYRFVLNFDHPFTATSAREFWTRWHISLSSWFRDYVYVPLGGSRHGPVRTHLNLWLTMLASGLWHGAGLTYLAWGAWHSAVLSAERLTGWPERLRRLPGGAFLACLGLNVIVLLGWVFFRAGSIGAARGILHRMLAWHDGPFRLPALPLVLLAVAVLLEVGGPFAGPRAASWGGPRARAWACGVLGAAASAAVFLRGPGATFIYFQF
jgi:D-alanyl-lipoteichoic acid acyltransferase DltB (MBOAT superfamily)